MKRMWMFCGMLICAALAYAQAPEIVPGQALVRFAEKTSLEQARGQFDPALFTVDDVLVKKLDIYLVTFDDKLAVEQALDMLRGYPQVKWAQADHILKQRAIPNDPSFASQWDMQQASDVDIDAPQAWDITTGGTDAGGNQIVVAVVDGGCLLTHTDLSANIWQNTLEVNGVAGVDDDGNGYVDDKNGWDGYANDGTIPTDNHGTHVSGTVGARGNNGSMVTGVNWNVKIMEVAASSSQTSVIQRGYGYVLDQKTLWLSSGGTQGANVVSTNSSFGVDLAFCTSGTYPTWNDLYNAMGEVGILSACATANANYNVDTQGDVPTSCSSPYMISVTNTTSTDAKNSSAGYGLTTIDLGAPGTSILSTLSSGSTGTLTGTSMSTPHVAGAVALMHAAASLGFYNYNTLHPDSGALALKQMLLAGTDPIAALQGITVSGGRLNLYNSCLAISQYVGLNPTEPFVSLVSAAFDDTTLGNADGVWRAGETVEVVVTLNNIGEDALNVQGVLSSADANVMITDATSSFGDILNGGQGDNSASRFAVLLSVDAPLAHTIEFTLDVTADSGYVQQLSFSLDANPKVEYYLETFESGAPDWTHGVVTGATDQWHLSTEMNYSPTHAWKCGSTTTGTYASSQDAGLISPAILLSAQSELRFRHWLQSETSTTYPDSAYDGGIVELSLNGGAYSRITPVGNYPKTYRLTAGGANPFTGPLPGVPCYAGTINWAEAVFDLSAYADSSARFRFRFSSDVNTAQEGWYVDDIRLFGAPEVVEIVPVDDLVILPVGNDAQLLWSPSSTPAAVYQVYFSSDMGIDPVDGTHLGATSDTTYTHVGGFLAGEFGAYQVVVTLP